MLPGTVVGARDIKMFDATAFILEKLCALAVAVANDLASLGLQKGPR